MAKLPLRVSPRAQRQIADAADWWCKNRSKAPRAFAEDMRAAIKLIRENPAVGAAMKSDRVAGVRRLVARRIRYALYYQVDGQRIDLLAVWHTSRGSQPPL